MPGSAADGSDRSEVDGAAGPAPDGTAESAADGDAGPAPDGTGRSIVGGAAGTAPDGTALSAAAGAAGLVADCAGRSEVDGAAGAEAEGAALSGPGGSPGLSAEGTARSGVDGSPGLDADGAVGPVVDGAGVGDGGSASAAAGPHTTAHPIASVTATLRRHFTTTHPPCQSCTRTEGRAEVEQSRQIRHTRGARRQRPTPHQLPKDTPGPAHFGGSATAHHLVSSSGLYPAPASAAATSPSEPPPAASHPCRCAAFRRCRCSRCSDVGSCPANRDCTTDDHMSRVRTAWSISSKSVQPVFIALGGLIAGATSPRVAIGCAAAALLGGSALLPWRTETTPPRGIDGSSFAQRAV